MASLKKHINLISIRKDFNDNECELLKAEMMFIYISSVFVYMINLIFSRTKKFEFDRKFICEVFKSQRLTIQNI